MNKKEAKKEYKKLKKEYKKLKSMTFLDTIFLPLYISDGFWGSISSNPNLSLNFLEYYKHKLYWNDISEYNKNLTIDFILKYEDKLFISIISGRKKFVTEEFIDIFKDYRRFDWGSISSTTSLLKCSFLKKYESYLDWQLVTRRINITKSIARNFKHYINWNLASAYQDLKEDFIREFKDEVTWDKITLYQPMSEDFIREFQDKIVWDKLIVKKTEGIERDFSDAFIYEFKNKLNIKKLEKEGFVKKNFIQIYRKNHLKEQLSRFDLIDI